MSKLSNVKRLTIIKMSADATPKGSGIGDVLRMLSSRESIASAAKAATKWVEEAIAAVKSAPDNPYGDDDEAIAGAIIAKLAEKDPSMCPKCGRYRTKLGSLGYRCFGCEG